MGPLFIAGKLQKWGCLLAIVGLLVVGGSCQAVWTAFQNPEPTELTCAEYIDSPADAHWLALRDCRIDLTDAVYGLGLLDEHSSSPVNSAYLPLHAVTSDKSVEHSSRETTNIVVETEDPGLMEVVTRLRDLRQQRDNESKRSAARRVEAYVADHRDEVVRRHDFTGMVAYGLNATSDEYEDVEPLKDQLTDDFAVLNAGESPSFSGAISQFGGGIVAMLVGLGIGYAGVRREEKEEEDE